MPSIFISSHCSWLPKQGEKRRRGGGERAGVVGHMTCAMPTISEVRRRKICRKIISLYLIFCCICLASLSAFTLLTIFLCCFCFFFCRFWSSSLVAAGPNFICRLTSCCCGAVETLPKRPASLQHFLANLLSPPGTGKGADQRRGRK